MLARLLIGILLILPLGAAANADWEDLSDFGPCRLQADNLLARGMEIESAFGDQESKEWLFMSVSKDGKNLDPSAGRCELESYPSGACAARCSIPVS